MFFAYQLLAYATCFLGFYTGIYVLSRAFRMYETSNLVLFVNLMVLGFLDLLVGVVYAVHLLDPTFFYSISSISTYMRPIVLLYIVTTSLIVRRVV